jgi:hypothetical protein
MRSRVRFGRFLIRFGRFIQSLALMVMRPADLVEFSRQDYSTLQELKYWSEKVVEGLNPLESSFLEQVPIKKGRVLLLGLGGGGRRSLWQSMGLKSRGWTLSRNWCRKLERMLPGEG